MKLDFPIIALFSLFAPIAVHGQSTTHDTAEALVAKGLQLHSNRNYDLAADTFHAALKEAPQHKAAAYHLACSLAMRLASDRNSWDQIEGETSSGENNVDPFAALAKAIKADPEAARKAATDWDFIHIRLTPRFQMLIGADLKNRELVKLLLVANSIWYHPPHGVWNGDDLLFLETGEVKRRMFVIDEHNENVIRLENGRYAVDEKGDITVTFTSGEALRGKFAENGTLELADGKTTNYTCYPIHDM